MNNSQVRLQKYLARCGIASRRASEKLMQEGRITVNDVVATKLGTKINPDTDVVKFDGNKVFPTNSDISLVLNKPAGYVCTMKDPQGRPCVADLVPVDQYPSLFPVGRLDRLTCGLLLFTTDGQLGQSLLHPKYETNKVYEVVIDGKLIADMPAFDKLQSGVQIKTGLTCPATLEILEHFDFNKYLDYENCFFESCAKSTDRDSLPGEKELIDKTFTRLNICIHEGKNRQVRRMFEAVGFTVLLLTRKSIGNLKLSDIKRGKWAKLKPGEIEELTC